MLRSTLAAAASLAIVTLAGSVSAQALAGHNRSLWFAASVGPTINVANDLGVEAGFAALSLQQQVGVRLSTGAVGASIALDFRESFASGRVLGGLVSWSGFQFEVGPRTWFDLPFGPSRSFSIRPNLGMHFLLLQRNAAALGFAGGRTDYGFAPQVALDLQVVLFDRLTVFVRPFGLDIAVIFERGGSSLGSSAVRHQVGYDLQLGAGVTF